MTKWKLCRLLYGREVFTLSEGEEVTIGRSLNNTITLSSFVISRNHCVLTVHKNKVLITDLKSSNGVYVGITKIPQNKPYVLRDSAIVGIGWTSGAPLAKINNEEKFIFKLCKENSESVISNRITFQSENELDEIEAHVAALHCDPKNQSSVFSPKLSLKRKADDKINEIKVEIKEKKKCRIFTIDDEIVNLLSDSENEFQKKEADSMKNIKLEPISEEPLRETLKDMIKCENDENEYNAFDVKQEYLAYDDEPIKVDSDSDSESEHWYLRLSQSSPGKPFIRKSQERTDSKQEDSSYSQMDDDYINFVDNEEDYLDDLITIPPEPSKQTAPITQEKSDEEDLDDIISLNATTLPPAEHVDSTSKDEVDAHSSDQTYNNIEKHVEMPIIEPQITLVKQAQMIEPLQVHKHKNKHESEEKKSKGTSSKHRKIKNHSNRKHITNSQKEERKKRLREIATKGKEHESNLNNSSNSSKIHKSTSVNKVVSSNRGAFLTDSVQVVKPVTRKEESKEPKSKQKSSSSPPKPESHNKQAGDSISTESLIDVENRKKHTDISTKDDKPSKTKNDVRSHTSSDVREPLKNLKPERESEETSKNKSSHNKLPAPSKTHKSRVPLKSVKPLSENETHSGKPFSKVEPLPPKKVKKTVTFSEAGPEVHVFEIEPGNKMKKTNLVKMTLVDTRQMPVFSLEKITLMKILRWNPQWLEEQINNNDPPPILGHNNRPMRTLHAYVNHYQYVQLVGDLLLMEIWECLSMAYLKIRNKGMGLLMRIESLPPMPTQERCYDLLNLSVNISVPSNSPKHNIPRVGEILLVTFGPENAKTKRFFFVHNVRLLPSPPNNIHSFYSISLHTTFTDKMKTLKQGEAIVGVSLAYINKELNLFEAMEYLAGSPLSEAILKPEPRHFQINYVPGNEIKSQWTKTLNPSQQEAVRCSVSAALGDKPIIQMVQGPPGTGKSSVICAMVMTYFYDERGRRQQNRGKVLICATSNAAVDELVIRLLNIRQSLPKTERFRMVRVGRAEAMHSRARDVSSQQLAQRDAVRHDPVPSAVLHEEISHLEAKINMWKTAVQDAKDPQRVAYCEGRITELYKRITMVKSGGCGGGEELRPDQLVAAERRIIEGADIVVTTLASAHSHKMKGLKRRIALCVIDEAGQAIEPETLIPLTLDVTRLTLIGDPQQLPGYICSQRAKQHGLGESLFSRLTSNTEHWKDGSPVVLLNQQYRMHPDIAEYPNRAFYGGLVHSSAPQRPLDLATPPYVIVSISSGDKGQGSSGANEMEAWGVSRLVAAINVTLRGRGLSLAVITPYNAHKELIKKHLRTLQDPSEPPVEVNTVDSFQGQERDVVVVSLARSQGVGFLTDAGRMNVMLTRAKHALLVCLNPHAIIKNHQWRTLVEDAQRRNMYRVLPNKMCQPTTAGAQPQDEILKYISVTK